MPNERSAARSDGSTPPGSDERRSVLSASGAHVSASNPRESRRALSEALEDYLEIILALSLENPAVRVRDIARAKGVRMPSVTAALRRLSERGLVSYQAREYVGLTSEGEAIARRLTGRHRFLTRFLHELLSVPEDVAERDACGLEHHLSARSLDRLAAFAEYIDTCPQVGAEFLNRFKTCFNQPDSLASCSDRCSEGAQCERGFAGQREIHAIRALPVGSCGDMVRIRAAGKLRDGLVEQGLLPGSRVEKRSGERGRGPAVVRVRGQDIRLTAREAAVIFVEIASDEDGNRSESA